MKAWVKVKRMKMGIIYLFGLLLTILILISCVSRAPRNKEKALQSAKKQFKLFINQDQIDPNLFRGPFFTEENAKEFLFRWYCDTPRPASTIWEIRVPKNSNDMIFAHDYGPRPKYSYLTGSNGLPINQAALRNLFHLPLDPTIINDRIMRLSILPLDTAQLEDIANFVEISWDLSFYASCFNCRLPDSLNDLKEISDSRCSVHKLDSLYLHDRYGHKYVYENLVNFALLGTPGENGIWDFEKTVIDSIYNDQMEHIYIRGDDIIVKFKPSSGCN